MPLCVDGNVSVYAIDHGWRWGAIYAIGHVQPDGQIIQPFKVGRVGIFGCVKNRLTALQTGTSIKLGIALIQPVRFSSHGVEKLVHVGLAKRRMRGEWFDCSRDRIRQVIDAALKYEQEPVPRKIQASLAAQKYIYLILRRRGADAIRDWKQLGGWVDRT